jgi:Tol biopolymer transport system component
VAGGQAEKVLDGISRAALSPDGRTMAVMARESGGLYRLAFSSPPGSTWQGYAQEPISKMRSIPGGNSSLQFSRDGKYLGFYTDAAGRVQFWKIPMDGGPPEEAHLGKIPQTTPTRFAWLPDARGIVSGTEGARASAPLWIWDFLAGTQQALTAGAGNEGFPAFSADGRMLAYSGGARGYDVLEVPLDGSAPRDLIATSRMEVAPSVAPDGIHFAYITDRSGADEIWLRNRQDGSERLVVGRGKSSGDEIHLLDCAISPDGSRVAYRRTQAGSVQIWIAPLSGESPVPLWEDSERVFQRGAAWSPDGNWIAFYSTRDGKNAVLKARVGASMRPDLVAYTESPQPVRWSPRGDWIAFQDSIGLRVVSPDGKLNRVLNARQWLTYGWSNDGTALYGIASLETRRMSLARIDVATGKETRLTDLGPRQAAMDFGLLSGSFEYRGFSVQPDGKSFLTSVYRAKLDLWLLEDFDRKTRLLDRLWRREAD